MFKQLLAAVLTVLGIKSLEKKDGKSNLTDEQRTLLTDKYGEKFVQQFEKDLADFEKDDADTSSEVEAMRVKLEAEQEKFNKLKADYEKEKTAAAEKEKNLNNLINVLSDSPEREPEAQKADAVNPKKGFAVNPNFLHNQVLDNVFNGDGLKAMAADTIVTDELRTEFGKYISDMRYEIITLLFNKLQASQYMTTKMSEKTEWRAIQSHISDLMQKFTPYWTPSGQVKFTPITIPNRKHKINLPIKPAEIMEDVIAYLYDEGLQPKDMPIVKYIIEVLLKPKVEEEREQQIATGEYLEDNNTNKKDGDEGDTFGSIEGYVTTLKKLHADASIDMVRLLQGVELTRDNIYDEFDKLYMQMPEKYRTKKLPIFIDPDLFYMYSLSRDDKFPTSKNEDETKRRLQHTNFVFTPLDGMTGTGCFFITPKENFIHLLSKNRGTTKIWLQAENYDVKIFAEWWEAVGFAIAELLFGYVPPASGSGNDQSV